MVIKEGFDASFKTIFFNYGFISNDYVIVDRRNENDNNNNRKSFSLKIFIEAVFFYCETQ